MKRQHRHQVNNRLIADSNQAMPKTEPEPQGYIHPNYRYLLWFRPSSVKNLV